MKVLSAARLAAFFRPARRRVAGGSAWLPLALLLAALATVFLFGNDRGSFYRMSHHDIISKNHLTLANNMSPEQRFLGFLYRWQDAEGNIAYTLYNRFPVGGYLLIKLSILPFGDNLAAQLYSARILLLLGGAAAAVLAYLSLSRLTGRRWIALTATLLTFASPYWLFYNDIVTPEVGLDFFGVMLTFHGMVLFVQEGRFRQLLVKSCLALLVGWHVYTLLGLFILMGLAGQFFSRFPFLGGWLPFKFRGRAVGKGERAAIAEGIDAAAAGTTSRRPGLWPLLWENRYLRLGLATGLCGAALLSFNLGNEYLAWRGEIGLTEGSTFRSIERRLSLNAIPGFSNSLSGAAGSYDFQGGADYWRQQFYRIGGMATPYALPGYDNALSRYFINRGEFPGEDDRAFPGVLLGLAVTGLALLVLAFARDKRLWATLALSGFGWALLVPSNVADHEFESLIYTGLVLTAWSLGLLYLSRRGGRRFIAALAVAAALVFGWASFRMAAVGYSDAVLEIQDAALAELRVIQGITEGHSVAYSGEIPETTVATRHYLSQVIRAQPGVADYLILPLRLTGVTTLTPENRHLFLYRGGPAAADYLDRILAQAGPPLLQDNFAVYRYVSPTNPPEEWLFYVKARCRRADRLAPFLLHIFPVDPGQLPRERWASGFDNQDFAFVGYRWQVRERCIAGRPLPPYPIDTLRTGQLGPDGSLLWAGEIAMR